MPKARLEAFSDGVIAILITIMVLELKVPHGTDWASVRSAVFELLLYVLSFVMIGIYWSNHHHLLHAAEHVSGGILWANLHLLFWLSLIPFATTWMGESHFSSLPTAALGVVFLAAAIAYTILQLKIIAHTPKLAKAFGRDVKGKISTALYVTGIVLAFAHPLIADGCYAAVALIWLVPDRRIESQLPHRD
jgi:uncharacterized membrane protein